MTETHEAADPLRLPVRLSLLGGNCPFCWRAITEHEIENLSERRFRYTNSCSCLNYAEGVVEDDSTYYWEKVEFNPRSQSGRTIANWHQWQGSLPDSASPDPPTASESPGETSETEAERDVRLYEEAQIILHMYG